MNFWHLTPWHPIKILRVLIGLILDYLASFANVVQVTDEVGGYSGEIFVLNAY